MKSTILGGILFLAPLAVLSILLGKAYNLSLRVVRPIDARIPIESMGGVAFVNILAILLILVVCYIAGSLAKKAFFANRFQRIDGFLIDMIPPYAVFKGVVGGVSADERLQALLVPVLVRFDDYEQIAFEVERGETESVLFLPGAPSAWSGSTVIANNSRIHRLDVPAHQAVRLMRVFGRGSLKVRAEALEAAKRSA